MVKWWWYVQWNYDGIYNVMIMIYIQWGYDEVMMIFTHEIYLQDTDGIYNEALEFYETKWKENDDYLYTLGNFFELLFPPPPTSHKEFLLMSFLVMPEDIQIEKGFAAEQAHQPHSQMHLPDMGTDGCPWGWWALLAALNLALIDSFGAPQLNPERLHVSQYVALRSWSGSWKSRHGGLACRTWNFRSCGLLRGLLGNRGTRAKAGLWWRRLGQERAGAWGDSPQKSIQTLHFRSHYGLPKFPPPSISNFLASSLFSLAW